MLLSVPAVLSLTNGSTAGLGFLFISILFSYIPGGIPASVAGITYAITLQLTNRKIAIAMCAIAATATAAIISIYYIPKLIIALPAISFISALITIKISSKNFL